MKNEKQTEEFIPLSEILLNSQEENSSKNQNNEDIQWIEFVESNIYSDGYINISLKPNFR